MEINIKKNWKFWLGLLISIAIIWLISLYNIKTSNLWYIASFSPSAYENEYNKECELQDVNNEIVQSFVAKYDNLSKIYVKFANLKVEGRVLMSGGKGILGLRDDLGNIIANKDIDSKELISNVDYEFEFNPVADSKNKTYYLFFKCAETNNYGEFYKIVYSEKDILADGQLFINGEEIDGEIYFQEMYSSTAKVLPLLIYMAVITLILSLIIIYIYYSKNITVEKLFWVIIPPIFILFMLVMPAFKSHDEAFQWFRMQDIIQGKMLVNIEENEPVAELRGDIFDVTTLEPANINYRYIQEKLKKYDVENIEKAKVSIPTTSLYSPVQFMPQICGIVISKIIYDNAMFMAYAGRIANMVFAILLLYLALKKMPFGKLGLLVSMLFPIAVEDFTSLSADAITISVAYLFIAYILNIVFDENRRVNKKDTVIMLILSVVLALCKIVYLPIVGLLLLLNKEKFKSKKSCAITIICILLLATFFNLLWLHTANTYLELYKDGRATSQLTILLQDPIRFIQKVLFTANYYIGNYTQSLFGDELGWNEFAKMGYILPIAISILFLFINTADKTLKVKLNKYQNIIIALIVLAIIGLIFTSLYLQWTDSKDFAIKGIQGRYFIPIIPLITILIFSKIKLKSEYRQEELIKITGITICILYIYTLIKLLIVNI